MHGLSAKDHARTVPKAPLFDADSEFNHVPGALEENDPACSKYVLAP